MSHEGWGGGGVERNVKAQILLRDLKSGACDFPGLGRYPPDCQRSSLPAPAAGAAGEG